MDETKYLDGDRNGRKYYAPGVYSFPFEYELPIDIPISIEGKYGYVRYKVIAALNRPRLLDKKYKESFTVTKLFDINLFPEHQV